MRDVFAKHLAFKGVAQKDLMQPRNIGEFALEGIGLAGVVGAMTRWRRDKFLELITSRVPDWSNRKVGPI